MNHLTSEQLQEHIDGSLSSGGEQHLRSCAPCQAKAASLKAMDRLLRSMPLDQASPRFTERVMKELGLGASPSFAWTVLRNLAPLLSLAIVVTIVTLVLKFAGVFDTAEYRQTSAVTKTVYDSFGGAVGAGVQAMNQWVARYLPFAFTQNSYALTMFVLLFFGAVALVDKYFIMPRMRKRML
jgi:anti-sigma factor RsiW